MANPLGAEAIDRTIGHCLHKCWIPGDGIASVLALGEPGSGKVCLATLGLSLARENSPFWVIKTVRLSGILPPGVTKQLPLLWASLMHSPTKFSVFHYEEVSSRGAEIPAAITPAEHFVDMRLSVSQSTADGPGS